MLNQKDKREVIKRLRRMSGQIQGIERMMRNGRSVQDVFIQLKSVEQVIHKTIYDVFEAQLRKHLAERLAQRLATCPGNCTDAERLQFTRREFEKLDLKTIIDSLSWLGVDQVIKGKVRSINKSETIKKGNKQ